MNFEFDRKEMLQKEAQLKREIVFKEQAKSTRVKILFSILFRQNFIFHFGFFLSL